VSTPYEIGHTFEHAQEAAGAVRAALKLPSTFEQAPTAVILGSGLGAFAEELSKVGEAASHSLFYNNIPHFPRTSVDGHGSSLCFGHIGNTPVFVMQGRVHRYEGYTAAQVAFPVRMLACLGVKTLIVTNASGGINPDLSVGDLMLITDQINMTGDNPLLGRNDERFGTRFPDMSDTYSKSMRELALTSAKAEGIELKQGQYFGVLGPTYETPAEVRMIRTLGGDAVGMSTVFEVIAAKHSGLKVLGISSITNAASGTKPGTEVTHHDVMASAAKNSTKLSKLLTHLISHLPL
jgi:purine-nucleoside phosphorylase